jgi:DNA-binding PadR family transcriptional regulator
MSKKILQGAILENVLLNLIHDATDKGIHGYSILKTISKKFGARLGPSTLYSELRQLEKHGLLTSKWELTLGKARRQYQITRKGENQMREYFAEAKIFFPAFVIANSKIIAD